MTNMVLTIEENLPKSDLTPSETPGQPNTDRMMATLL